LLAHIVPIVGIVRRNLLQEIAERGHAVAGLFGKIRATEKRPSVVAIEEHGQRPATATLGDELVRGLVDLVDVGTLFAVDFDVDEQLVHQGRRGVILEGLVRHDMAPVAGGVTY